MSFIFLRNRVTGGAAFSPASLFASGEEGAWYEPSTATCFTDTAGTTAASVGDAVARINDLSGNGNHATQATSSARPILARVPPRGRVNELSETDTLATQSVTVTAAQRTLSFTGTGTVTLTGASTAGPLVGTGAGDRVSLTFTPSAGSLTLTVLGTVTDAQLELGASATTYQSVADSLGYDITEAGVTSLEYLAFDGSDDFLLWNGASIDMTSAVICVAAETTADGYFFDANEDLASSPQNRLGMRRQSGNFVLVDSTSSLRTGGAISGAHVLTGVWATNAGKTRIDGADDTAFGTFVNSSNDVQYMTIGTYYQALGAFFNGKIFGIIARGGGSTAQEISDTETYLASKSGVASELLSDTIYDRTFSAILDRSGATIERRA